MSGLRLTALTAVVAFVGVLLVHERLQRSGGEPVRWRDLSGEVGALQLAGPAERAFATRGQLSAYLRGAAPGRRQRSPRLDFSRFRVLLVSPGPRSATGYSVRVVGVEERRGEVVVTVREETPRLEADVEPRVTTPFALVAIPAGPKPLRVEWEERTR